MQPFNYKKKKLYKVHSQDSIFSSRETLEEGKIVTYFNNLDLNK